MIRKPRETWNIYTYPNAEIAENEDIFSWMPDDIKKSKN